MRKLLVLSLTALLALSASAALAATNLNSSKSNRTSAAGVHLAVKKTVQGTVKSVADNSFVLTVRKANFTVVLATSTRIVNRTWHKIALLDMRTGDVVR